MEVPWHFHLLVTSTADIPAEILEQSWRQQVLSKARLLREAELDDDTVLVESYKHNRLGPEYCLKSINNCHGDWTFRWLELFNPRIKQTSCPSHRKIRNRARFAAEQDELSRVSMTAPGITSPLPCVGRHG
jgi:hypothetical protein